jgi:hypothetical protein
MCTISAFQEGCGSRQDGEDSGEESCHLYMFPSIRTSGKNKTNLNPKGPVTSEERVEGKDVFASAHALRVCPGHLLSGLLQIDCLVHRYHGSTRSDKIDTIVLWQCDRDSRSSSWRSGQGLNEYFPVDDIAGHSPLVCLDLLPIVAYLIYSHSARKIAATVARV